MAKVFCLVVLLTFAQRKVTKGGKISPMLCKLIDTVNTFIYLNYLLRKLSSDSVEYRRFSQRKQYVRMS